MENSSRYNQSQKSELRSSIEADKNDALLSFHEIDRLSDDDLLRTSQEFGANYVGLLNSVNETELQHGITSRLNMEMQKLLSSIEGLDDDELIRTMVEGYRNAVNELHIKHGKAPVHVNQLNDEAYSHVTRPVTGPFGIPIIYTDGHNEDLLGTDTLSFAAPEVMIDNGMPPFVVVYDGYNAHEKQQVTTHETSHAVFALLIRAGIIPAEEGGGIPKSGQKSAFDLARDEAIAQMAAGQNSAAHPDVVNRMRHEKISENFITDYGDAINSFTKSDAEKSGLQFSDAILGVMMARSFSDLNTHMLRMANIASERVSSNNDDNTPNPAVSDGGWGSV